MCEPEGRPNERDVAGGGFIYPEERDRLDRFLSGVQTCPATRCSA